MVTSPNRDRRRCSASAIASCLPEAVGELVRWLVQESGWTVADAGSRRPIRAGDVCLLFRRFLDFQTDVTRAYVEALESREATVLRMRFGLGLPQSHTLKEIGTQLGLTRERVRQIETEALAKLADGLRDPASRAEL